MKQIIISIIRAYQNYKFLWLSLTIHLYQLSFLVSPLDGILCLYRTDKCKFLLVNQHWYIHRRMSLMSLSLLFQQPQHVLLILLGCFMRWEASGSTATVLWDATARICSKQHATSLNGPHLAFSPGNLLVQVVQV